MRAFVTVNSSGGSEAWILDGGEAPANRSRSRLPATKESEEMSSMKFMPLENAGTRAADRRALRKERERLLARLKTELPGTARAYRFEKRVQQIGEELRELDRLDAEEEEAPAATANASPPGRRSARRGETQYMPPRPYFEV